MNDLQTDSGGAPNSAGGQSLQSQIKLSADVGLSDLASEAMRGTYTNSTGGDYYPVQQDVQQRNAELALDHEKVVIKVSLGEAAELPKLPPSRPPVLIKQTSSQSDVVLHGAELLDVTDRKPPGQGNSP